MDILGIGPLELLAILVIALIVLGPKDMVKAGRTIGRTLRTIISSDTWRVVQQASREIRNLPNRMIREAGVEDLQKQLPNQSAISKQLGLDELKQDLNKDLNADLSPWTTPPPTIAPPNHRQTGEEAKSGTAEDAGAWAIPPVEGQETPGQELSQVTEGSPAASTSIDGTVPSESSQSEQDPAEPPSGEASNNKPEPTTQQGDVQEAESHSEERSRSEPD
jgi:sec-independent protein translocase protein TatB